MMAYGGLILIDNCMSLETPLTIAVSFGLLIEI